MKKFLSIVLAMVMMLSLGVLASETYPDGSFAGEGTGMMGPILVSVTVADGKITEIEVLEHTETDGIADPAFAEIPAAIIEAQSVEVDAVAGATYTSDGIMEAVFNALMGGDEQLEDGVYEGEGEGYGGPIKVAVTVVDGRVTEIAVLEHSETAGISDPAIAEMPAAIVGAQSTEVDVVAGATYTSQGILQAVENALFADEELQDGMYEGEGEGFGGPIKVSVTVADGMVTEIAVLEHSETAGISDPALLEIPAAIVEAQTTEVDVVAGATYTSEGIMQAVDNALLTDDQ